MATRISDFTTASTFDSTDLIPLARTSVTANRKMSIADFRAESDLWQRWKILASGVYTAAPSTDNFVSGSFAATAAWTNGAVTSLGAYVRPTAANGFIYECVTAGTTGGSEPSWGTTIGGNTTDNTVTWRCRGLSVITTVSDLSSTILAGYPLRYKYNSATYYGLCVGISSTKIAVAGAPLSSSHNLTELAYGFPERVVVLDFHIDGTYGDGAADLLGTDAQRYYRWTMGKAYLAHFAVKHRVNDTGANQPYVSPKLGGNIVSVDATNQGAQPTTSWVDHRWTNLSTSNYDIVYGDDVEVRCTAAGTNSDANDLSIMLAFVLE